jgi:anaphase-promoting complex subunit 3
VWDMEVYSSLLWQMGRGVELAFLAREMVDLAPGSGEAWIVVGNLFSVRKERERALGCFRRATELAGKGSVKAYAYTLCGHESLDEDLGSAIRYFERALGVDGGDTTMRGMDWGRAICGWGRCGWRSTILGGRWE